MTVTTVQRQREIVREAYHYRILPKRNTVERIPAGYYTVEYDSMNSDYLLEDEEMIENNMNLGTATDIEKNILSRIAKFFDPKTVETYKKYDTIHKQGILLYGPPGTGKTHIAKNCAQVFIKKYDGIVIADTGRVEWLHNMISHIKTVDPERKFMILLDEFDHNVEHEEEDLLSLLDGFASKPNVFVIACTNYIEKLPPRIIQRPSRFAKTIEVLPPSKEAKLKFLNAFVQEPERSELSSGGDFNVIINHADFTIDDMKNVILSMLCYGLDVLEACEAIRQLKKNGDLYEEEEY